MSERLFADELQLSKKNLSKEEKYRSAREKQRRVWKSEWESVKKGRRAGVIGEQT